MRAHVGLEMNSRALAAALSPNALTQYRFCGAAGFSNGRTVAVIKVSALMHAAWRKFANFNGDIEEAAPHSE
jgi:hypothetical protein